MSCIYDVSKQREINMNQQLWMVKAFLTIRHTVESV